jgi:prepilin-type N-terminal cleavage/methylation domain-containing protein
MEHKRGFTLIELMIVVAIIAVLAGVLIPNFVHARSQTATAACESNLRAIATAAELYFTDNQTYPASTNAVDRNFGVGDGAAAGTYLNNTPVDPAASTATARYTFTNDGSAAAPHYTITCPGLHDPASLAKIGGGTAAQAIDYTSDTGLGVGK